MSGLVRARGLKHYFVTGMEAVAVRARKSPWIETGEVDRAVEEDESGLVRARGLKRRASQAGRD